MTAKEQGLPELPEVDGWIGPQNDPASMRPAWDEASMRAYALAALASDTGERGGELGDAAETLRYFADVCKGNCPVGQWPGNKLIEAIHTVLTELADASLRSRGMGFIVSNGKGNAWRMWDEAGPEWTYDRDKALRFARREDAEVFAREDEDAWRIEPFAALRAQPAGGGCLDWRERYHDRCRVISDWHQRAVALGYEGVNDLLTLALPCIVNNAGDERPLTQPQPVEGKKVTPLSPLAEIDAYNRAATPPESGGQGELIPPRDAPAEELWAAIYRLAAIAYRVEDGKPWMHVAAQLRMEAKAHPPAQASGAVTEAMVEAALKVEAFERDGALWPDAYSSDEQVMERGFMWKTLTAALAQGGGNER